MRRYELMLVLRPDLPDDRTQAVLDRTTRGIAASGGQIVKVASWGRRRLAYPIDRYREGSYHILIFEAPAEAIGELERSLLITEEVLRHLVTRVERPVRAGRRDGTTDDSVDGTEDLAAPVDEVEEEDEGERIDESESEAAPAAIE
jgi:small subunit ribosomal protein S6